MAPAMPDKQKQSQLDGQMPKFSLKSCHTTGITNILISHPQTHFN